MEHFIYFFRTTRQMNISYSKRLYQIICFMPFAEIQKNSGYSIKNKELNIGTGFIDRQYF